MPAGSPQALLAAQEINDAHDAFLVDTGGIRGTLLVTAALGERAAETEMGGWQVAFSVWDPAEPATPLQTFSCELAAVPLGTHEVVDANFDGFQDFGVLYAHGNQAASWRFWLWDETRGQFAESVALSGIFSPQFDAGKQLVTGWHRGSAAAGTWTCWRWTAQELVLIRRITYHQPERETDRQLVTVEDLQDGRLVEVHRRHIAPAEGRDALLADGWYDPDFPEKSAS